MTRWLKINPDFKLVKNKSKLSVVIMPEINEVRKYADFISKKCKDKNILEIKIVKGRYKKHGPFDNYKELVNNLPLNY